MTRKNSKTIKTDQQLDYWQSKIKLNGKGKKLFNQIIYLDWCKACGICIAFCPKKVFVASEAEKPIAEKEDDCIGCRFCETHCPDFAISIEERFADHRRNNNGN